jgi:hypothetical protein
MERERPYKYQDRLATLRGETSSTLARHCSKCEPAICGVGDPNGRMIAHAAFVTDLESEITGHELQRRFSFARRPNLGPAAHIAR